MTLDTISDGIPWLADTTLDSISWSEQPAVAPSFTVSASMFPEFFVVDDFVLSNIDDYESDPPETRQMRLERRWIFTQHYWHLVFSNRQLERLTFAGAVYVPWEIRSEQMFLDGIAKLTHPKEMNGWDFDGTSCF